MAAWQTIPSVEVATRFQQVRRQTLDLCRGLSAEDLLVQSMPDASPGKWHLAHTSWFFEQFVLGRDPAYRPRDPAWYYLFNSYYQSVGPMHARPQRGLLSRPSLDEVRAYRQYIDDAVSELLVSDDDPELAALVELGLQHEQQHQELLLTDILNAFFTNPLRPSYRDHGPGIREGKTDNWGQKLSLDFKQFEGGLKETGNSGNGFCFDNELAPHKVFLNEFRIAAGPVTNQEYLEFMASGGYGNFVWWHAEGWDWVKKNAVTAPLYWHLIDGQWQQYTLTGLQPVDPQQPVGHISYYEATAYAAWKGCRLPTEWEWEAASGEFTWGKRWEWTESAYLPYPGFKKAPGAIGEYNGKFMVSQMVLRGASVATPADHSRTTYRNFFHPHLRWQFTGIRLAL